MNATASKVSSLILALCAAAGIGAAGYAWAGVVTGLYTWLGLWAWLSTALYLLHLLSVAVAAVMAGRAVYAWAVDNNIADAVSGAYDSVRNKFVGA